MVKNPEIVIYNSHIIPMKVLPLLSPKHPKSHLTPPNLLECLFNTFQVDPKDYLLPQNLPNTPLKLPLIPLHNTALKYPLKSSPNILSEPP